MLADAADEMVGSVPVTSSYSERATDISNGVRLKAGRKTMCKETVCSRFVLCGVALVWLLLGTPAVLGVSVFDLSLTSAHSMHIKFKVTKGVYDPEVVAICRHTEKPIMLADAA